MTEDERFARLRLARTERVGPVAFSELLKRFGSAERALAEAPAVARRAGGNLVPPTVEAVRRELDAGERLGARLIVVGEPAYPPLLARLDPPPPVLWARGDAALLRKEAVAVVGARVASASGQRFARGLAAELGEAGLLVVSGLARGIDSAAHEGALPTGTAAVLGGGVDDVYPPENAALYERVVAEGCVVSESPVGARAQARDFPRRNRIVSGLSLGVIVVEAELRSGSLITARLAGEQGRDVFAVPGSPLDPRAKGANDLIRQGAVLTESAEDVLRVLRSPGLMREPDAQFDGPTPGQDGPDAEIDRVRTLVEALLAPVPTPRDELVRATGASPSVVFAALVELALAGKAELTAGGLVCRT